MATNNSNNKQQMTKFGIDFTKTGHVQDIKHIQVNLQDHDEMSDMDDQVKDADDKMKRIAILEDDDDSTDNVETETIGTDADEMEELPLNKFNNNQSNATDSQALYDYINYQKIKNYQSNSIINTNDTPDNKGLLDNETTLGGSVNNISFKVKEQNIKT
ncbi:hypothetical protein ACTA71_004140 [Dictyostelium dimigraforme]